MTSRDVIATGLGCICAAGGSVPGTLDAMYRGERSPRPPARVQIDLDREHPVFEIESDLDGEMAGLAGSADFGEARLDIDPSRTSRLALLAAVEACREAALDLDGLRTLRVGVCIGTTVGCTLNDEPFYRAWRDGLMPDTEPVARYLANNPALFVARALGLHGPVVTLANACSSGTDAVGLAKGWVESGQCDVAIAGGSDELSRVTCLGFISLMIASPDACRPFDRRRTGLNLGEGAGMLVLESRESADARAARPLARVLGYACNSDAYHPTGPHPEGRGLRRAMDRALRQAGREASEVGFVNAHGTSTPDNDRVEGRALADLLSTDTPVVATKAYTGHTLGAAGAIEAALTIRGLIDQKLPATAGFGEPDPECAIVPTSRVTPVDARTALSNSLAFGGTNSTLVFGKE